MTNSFNSTSIQGESTKHTLEELLAIFLDEKLPLSSQQIENLNDPYEFSVVWSDHYDKKIVEGKNERITGELQNDFLLGSADDEKLIGKGGDDFIWGNAGNDKIINESGKDILIGGSGDDLYRLTNLDTLIVETSENGGVDTVFITSGGKPYTIPENVERLVIEAEEEIGNNDIVHTTVYHDSTDDNIIEVRGANNLVIHGSQGDDTYILSSLASNIKLNESEGEFYGSDWIIYEPTQEENGINEYTIPENIENMTLSETAGNIQITGNDENNSIIGNNKNNTLIGSSGNDYLKGKDGINRLEGGPDDDTYEISSVNNIIIEKPEPGIDWIIAEISNDESLAIFDMYENIENIQLGEVTTNIQINGNDGDNIFIGNSNENILAGGGGNDTYRISTDKNTIQEEDGENSGSDWIKANISESQSMTKFDIPKNVENIEIGKESKNIQINGNNTDNIIIGNGDNNTLIGGEGNDYLDGKDGINHLEGGLDDDTYMISTVNDAIIEKSESGNDWIIAEISDAELSSQFDMPENVENLKLGETSANIQINGNDGDNIFIGNNQDNILSGGDGNDIYRLSSGKNAIYEGNGQNSGIDWIRGYFTSTEGSIFYGVLNEEDEDIDIYAYTMPDNVENLLLEESSKVRLILGNEEDNTLTGNEGTNILLGNSGDDVLNGKQGANYLLGGLDDDTYIISSVNNTVIEEFDSGNDWIVAEISEAELSARFDMPENVENLKIEEGSKNIKIVGNLLNNKIQGDSQDNFLNGGNGDDILKGQIGKDLLEGGDGNDYLYGGKGHDTMEGGKGNDLFIVNLNDYEVGDTTPDIIKDFDRTSDFIQIDTSTQNQPVKGQFLSKSNFASTTADQLEGKNGLQSSAEYVFDESQGILYHNDNGTQPGVVTNQNGILDLGANTELSHEDILIS